MLLAKSLRTLLAVGFVLLIAMGCAPSATPTPVPPTATPTPVLATSAKDIVGTWVGVGGADGLYQRFNEDGTCQVATSLEALATKPAAECTFQFEGTRLSLTEVKTTGLPECSPAKTGIYEVHLLANGNIKFVKIQDACSHRANSTAMEHKPVH